MIVVRTFEGQRVGVLGMGRSGLAAAGALQAGGADPICWDDSPEGRKAGVNAGFTVRDLTREREWEGVTALIVSPGIPHLYPAPHPAIERAMAAGIPVDNDIGLFFREMGAWEPGLDDVGDGDPTIVCVTGSNGKSTTSALIHHILNGAGREAQLGGNIGVGVLDLDYPTSQDTIVLELSSYQTDLARSLAPDIAVFLNLSDDHLDRHAGRGGYFAAKARLFEAGAPERVVIGVDEPEGRYLANRLEGVADKIIRIGGREGWTVSMKKSFLTERQNGKQTGSFDLRAAPALRGAHNGQNACAAWAACRMMGLGPKQIEAGLVSFAGLPHRLEHIAEIDGVTYVNDSKATNADAAEKALLSYENIRWIVGGQPKEGGIASLLPLLDRVKKTYLIGHAQQAFATQLGDAPHTLCDTLENAIATAKADAEPGETILLAPACASFDQFTSFEARGEAFREAVAELLKTR